VAFRFRPAHGSGCDPGGLQYILAGWQSGTVYKPVPVEAAAAARVAIDMINGKPIKTNGVTSNGSRKVLPLLETPIWVTKTNHSILFTSGFLKKSQVCVGQYKKYCAPAA
jgi:D-xylose transport system substrate-binding protein